ncbi:MAG: lysophospholipid acyltransferase family protein [Nitrospirae bacterium]|nr:lysophospholipid acyltransferase family protein [Nitrospirota bacterium]MBF0536018.1 lysophospholipid acyltransferase family protein [Nitrospirota bacterium]MBF0617906.1 lysophospholipid acyltransferase family protein [Nitrospirota bacterium]
MVTQESIYRDILRLLVWYPFRWFIEKSTVEAGIQALKKMGQLHFTLARGGHCALMKNISKVKECSTEEKYEIIKQYYENHYVDRLLIFIFPRFGKKEIDKLIEFEGLNNLDEALAKGRGVVLIHGHFGPVHLPLVALSRMGYHLKQIGLPSDEGLSWTGKNVAFRLRMKYERLIPAEIINAESFLRPAFKWLKENGIIMITGDGSGTTKHVGKHEVFDFLGQQVSIPLGPATLALKTGASLNPLFIEPGAKKAYKITIGPAINQNGENTPTAHAQKFLQLYEKRIRKFPGFMHFLDRFEENRMIIAKHEHQK